MFGLWDFLIISTIVTFGYKAYSEYLQSKNNNNKNK